MPKKKKEVKKEVKKSSVIVDKFHPNYNKNKEPEDFHDPLDKSNIDLKDKHQ